MVTEVIQTQKTNSQPGSVAASELPVRGGATLLFNNDGTVRYAIRKSLKAARSNRQARAYSYQIWERASAPAYGNDLTEGMDFRAIHRGY